MQLSTQVARIMIPRDLQAPMQPHCDRSVHHGLDSSFLACRLSELRMYVCKAPHLVLSL